MSDSEFARLARTVISANRGLSESSQTVVRLPTPTVEYVQVQKSNSNPSERGGGFITTCPVPMSPGIVGILTPPLNECLEARIREAEEKHLGQDLQWKPDYQENGLRNLHTGQLLPKHRLKSKIRKYQGYIERAYSLVNTGKHDSIVEGYTMLGNVMNNAWNQARIGHELGNNLCDYIRENAYLDDLLQQFIDPSADEDIRFAAASGLHELMSSQNRSYIVANDYLEPVVITAKNFIKTANITQVLFATKVDKERIRIVLSLMESAFKHSPQTSSTLIDLGILDMIVSTIRKTNRGTEVLRHAALALANLAMYSDSQCDQKIITHKVPNWLFLLASNPDNVTCYYACLAICVLSSKKEIEGVVAKSGTLKLVEPFLTTHKPELFVKCHYKLAQGRPKGWLRRLVPMLKANRTEARSLAAFHFCMEAMVKRSHECLEVLHEIGAVKELKEVASNPDEIPARLAAQALTIIGAEVPYRLCQQVPLWKVEDVQYWVAKIGFESYGTKFAEQMVDGDLLLLLTEKELQNDIKMDSGLLRKRFLRELEALKISADYSCVDESNLDGFLMSVHPELSSFTYRMLELGFDKSILFDLEEDEVTSLCGIENPVQRLRLTRALQECRDKDDVDLAMLSKEIDIFISYRRSTGNQLASLLKVMLQLRGWKVFIDVERLNAGKFDTSLLKNIQAANHFILILSDHSFDRLLDDDECEDWIHKELVCAMQYSKNIIPVFDGNFQFPDENHIPKDIRSITRFNGIRWVHEYQEACIGKLERFLRGEEVQPISSRPLSATPRKGSIANKNLYLSVPQVDMKRSSSVPSLEKIINPA